MDPTLYLIIKDIHIATAAISISCFLYRGLKKLQQSQYRPPRWLRVLPHCNDTVLLSCAIYLAITSHQYPFSSHWLTAKVIALLIYIVMGMVVMRFAKNQRQRLLAFIAALLSFSYIAAVALSRSPTLSI